MEELRKKAEDHYSKEVLEEVLLLELEWYTKEVIVIYVQCDKCEEKGCHIEENRRQEVIKDRKR